MTTTAADLMVRFSSDTSGADKGFAKTNKQIDGTVKKSKGLGSSFASVFGGVVAANVATQAFHAISGGISGAIDASSNLNESMTKSAAIFVDNAKGVQDWSKGAATGLGISQQAALESASTFANLFKGVGIANKDLPSFSENLVQAASDLGSFNNVDPSQVLQDIQSGLVGEAEPLRKYGILLNETAVGQEAMAETGKTSTDQLTEGEKVAARYHLIMKGLGDAQGDFTKTSKGLANQQRILNARMSDFKAKLGTLALPLASFATGIGIKLLGGFTKLIPKITNFLRPLGTMGKIFGDAFKGGFQFDKLIKEMPKPLQRTAHALGSIAEAVGDMIRNGFSKNELLQAWHGVQAIGQEIGKGITWAANVAIDTAVSVAGWLWDHKGDIWGGIKSFIGWTTDTFSDAITATIDGAIHLAGDLADAAGNLWGWIKAQLFGRTGSISQDPASPLFGVQQSTVDIGVLDVAAKIGHILAEKGEDLINNLGLQIAAWTNADHPQLEALGVDVNALSPTFTDLAKSDFAQAVKDAVTADPINVTPDMEINIHDSVANWVRNFDPSVDLGDIKTDAKWLGIATLLFANFPLVVAGYITKVIGPDLVRVVGAAISGVFDGLFSGQSSFIRKGYPESSYQPGLFEGLGDLIQTSLTTALDLFTPDVGDFGSKITAALGTAWVDALATFTSHFKPDFSFVGTAIQAALDAIPKPHVPKWVTDPIGWALDQLPGGGGGGNDADYGTAFTQLVGNNGYPAGSSGGKAFFTPLRLKPVIDAPDTSKFDTGMSAITDQLKRTITDTTYTTTLDANIQPAVQQATAATLLGAAWQAATFTSHFDINNGPAAIAYTNAFTWGNVWASQVFTATFSVNLAPIYAAVEVVRWAAQTIADLLPHSPAKKGPLSKPISFAYIADAARRDLRGVGDVVGGSLRGSHRVALAGSGRGHTTINNYALKSDELVRMMKMSEAGGSFAHTFPRSLALSGG